MLLRSLRSAGGLAGLVLMFTAGSASAYPKNLILESDFLSYEAGVSGAFTVADFNEDLLPDIVCLSTIENRGYVLINGGDGYFAAPVPFQTAQLPLDVASGDINNDGHFDLVITCNGSDYIYSMLGNGDGTFQWPNVQITGDGPSPVALADVNRDGKLDAVVANATGHSLSVLPGLGNGYFAAQASYPVSYGTDDDVAVGLLNDDLWPDVICAGGAVLAIYLNDGAGGFGPPQYINTGSPAEVVIRDLDFDGVQDVLVVNDSNNNVRVLRGNGDGTFVSSGTYATGDRPESLDLADLNGDDVPDIVVGNNNGDRFTVWFGAGGGTFANRADSRTTKSVRQVRAADMDGDGWMDVVASSSGRVAVAFNRWSGLFGRGTSYPVTDARAVAAADFDEDGVVDVVACGGSTVSLLPGDGIFGLEPAALFPTGSTPLSIVAADFDLDGHMDVATANSATNTVSVLAGNGDGTFDPKTDYIAGSNPYGLVTGDFNEDGKPDIATASTGSSTVSVLINAGGGQFYYPVSYPGGSGLAWIVAGDLNHDGHLDLVALNRNAGGLPACPSIGRYLGNGDGTFGTPHFVCVAGQSVDLGDVNGDGNLDVVAVNGSGTLSFLRGDGLGGFAPAVTQAGSKYGYAVALADLDRDGRLDVVISTGSGDYVTVRFGAGDGTFGAPLDYGTGDRTYGLFAGDLNGDGFPDMVGANGSARTVSLLLNRYNAISGTAADDGPRPAAGLSPAWPNPFRELTSFDVSVTEPSRTRVAVFDVQGRRIRLLTEGWRDAGRYRVRWDGAADDGDPAGAGIYYIRLETTAGSGSRKVLRLR